MISLLIIIAKYCYIVFRIPLAMPDLHGVSHLFRIETELEQYIYEAHRQPSEELAFGPKGQLVLPSIPMYPAL